MKKLGRVVIVLAVAFTVSAIIFYVSDSILLLLKSAGDHRAVPFNRGRTLARLFRVCICNMAFVGRKESARRRRDEI